MLLIRLLRRRRRPPRDPVCAVAAARAVIPDADYPGRDEYRVVSGDPSERVFVALALTLALLFYPVSRVGFDGLIHRMGGDDQLCGRMTRVTDGDTIEVDAQGRITPVRLEGVDTPETVAPDEPVGCFGPEASEYTKQVLHERQTGAEGEVVREGRLVRLKIPRIGDSEDAYGRTSPTSTWTRTGTALANIPSTRTSSFFASHARQISLTSTDGGSSGCARRPRRGAGGRLSPGGWLTRESLRVFHSLWGHRTCSARCTQGTCMPDCTPADLPIPVGLLDRLVREM